MHTPGSGPIPAPDTWDDAPCGLLRVDADGLVLAANRRLLERLGYAPEDVIDRLHWNDLLAVGSRVFFQTQLAPVLELDGALEEVMLDLRAADGLRVPALVNAVRIGDDADGPAGARIAVMSVPDRRAYEEDLRHAREQAERAQAADARARFRLELLARANAALAGGADVEATLGRLTNVLVADLADWCVIYAIEPEQRSTVAFWSAAHKAPALQAPMQRLAELLPQHALPGSEFKKVFAGGRAVLMSAVTAHHQLRSTDSAEVLDLCRTVGLASAIVVPSRAGGAQVATIILARGAERGPFTEDDLADLTDLSARAGIVIDNMRRQAREHSNSLALQQALLTASPKVPGLEIATRYLPATAGNEVGGDWYDTFLQSDGTPVLVIGDVVGHDIHAAAAMGQLRGVIRSVGYTLATGSSGPDDILTRADATARGLGVDVLASAFLACLDVEGATLRWSNAGHPPPLLISAEGGVRTLDAPPDPILGIPFDRPRHEHTVELSAGDILLLYTDGLIERTDEDIDVSIAKLAARVANLQSQPLDDLCELVLADHHEGRRDDIALLVVRFYGRSA